jgi:hypothetical protein
MIKEKFLYLYCGRHSANLFALNRLGVLTMKKNGKKLMLDENILAYEF